MIADDKQPFYLASPVSVLMITVANLLLLVEQFNGVMLAFMLMAILWQAAITFNIVPSVHRLMLITFGVAGLGVLMVYSVTMGLLLTMVHLLCFAFSLKPLELKHRSDFFQFVLLSVFVVATSLIFQQSILFALLAFSVLFANLSLLYRQFSKSTGLSYSYVIAESGKMFVKSIPLAILLFLVLPRIPPFWKMPTSQTGKTGLSDSVQPGDIAQLALSNELAFRVKFSGREPLYNELYWRALVFEDYDGKRWYQDEQQTLSEFNQTIEPAGLAIRYQITLEPSQRPWVFALTPSTLVSMDETLSLKQFSDETWENNEPVIQASRYDMVSYSQAKRLWTLPLAQRQRNLAIDKAANPRLSAYAKQLRERFSPLQNESLIQAVLTRIRQQDYRYTLKPPLLSQNSLDQFFFDTRAGFCSHYASAFTYLMRASGIPARMVAGYMGGEFNVAGGYYNVYQRYAHAWSEVWLADKGWVRIDPTGAVSPERVEQGFSEELMTQQANINGDWLHFSPLTKSSLWQFLKQTLDTVDYQWTRFVIGYQAKQQFELLSRLFGTLSLWKIAGLMGASLLLSLAWLWWTHRIKVDFSQKPIWYKLQLKLFQLLAKHDLIKHKAQTLQEYQQEIIAKYPSLTQVISELFSALQALQFAELNETQQQTRLHQLQLLMKELKQQLKKLPQT